jgi:hypothetical protein
MSAKDPVSELLDLVNNSGFPFQMGVTRQIESALLSVARSLTLKTSRTAVSFTSRPSWNTEQAFFRTDRAVEQPGA